MLMRAALLETCGFPLVISRVERPVAGRGQLVVRLEASGVCHSDVHVWQGAVKPATPPSPFVLGHEGIGRVASMGAGVTGWQTGDRVGTPWIHSTCLACAECRAGEEAFCQSQLAHGFNVPGTFAEYVKVDAAFAIRVPDAADAAALAPLMCAGVTAYGAIARSALKPGETCAIFGCGGLGQYAVQLAARLGADVIAVDVQDARLEQAKTLGAGTTVNPSKSSLPRNCADVCINFAPTRATWSSMIGAIRPRGRIVSAAMVPADVPLNQEWLVTTGVTITGTSVGTRKQMNEFLATQEFEPMVCEVKRIGLSGVNAALVALFDGTSSHRYVIEY